MLKTLREAQTWIIKAVLWVVVLAFIGTIFLVWGMGGRTGQNTIATVRGTVISLGEFQTAYQNLLDTYQRIYKDRFTPELAQTLNLKQQALENLIQRHLLLQEAEKEGFVVTNAELVEQIQSYPAFQVGGRFNKERYRRILQLNRLTPADFEQQQRRDLLIQKLEKLIKDGVHISEQELREAYAKQHGKIKLQFLTLLPSLFEEEIGKTLTEEEIQKYYEENKELFRHPEQVRVRYLVLDSKPIEEKVVIDDEAVARYYEEHKENYKQEERVRARHILIKVAPDAKPEEEEKAKARAEAALKRVKSGEDFATVAKEVSEGPSASRGGDLGYFGRGAMVKPFEEVAFSLKPGEISDLVRTDFGYHIIKVEDKKEAGYRPLEEVKKLIANVLKREEVDKQLREKAEALREKIVDQGGNLEAVAAQEGIALHTSPFFAQNASKIEGIPYARPFATTAFSLKEDEVSEPLKVGRDYYLLQVMERKASYIPDFAEAKAEVRTKLLESKARKAAEEKAQAMAEELKKGSPIEKVAASMQLKVQKTDFLTRRDRLPDIGYNFTLLDTLFQLEPGETRVETVGGKYYVLQVVEKQLFDEEDFAKKRKELAEQLQRTKESLVFQAWLEALQKQADIRINEDLLALL
ncbi:MAG: hypothetical protein D6736_18915 [Nitrospinota bacterium]|nr:MAG: hypothetical protein D6736_18915 [Nitrospinota bacterium]